MKDRHCTTIKDAVKTFVDKSESVNQSLVRSVLERIFLTKIDGSKTIEELYKDKTCLENAIVNTMNSYNHEKIIAYYILREFCGFLNKSYAFNLNVTKLLKKPEIDKRERQIAILKKLHGRSISKSKIAKQYYITPRTLYSDLEELAKGINFLGQEIKVNIEGHESGRKITYKSTVHPVFLPLNMMEAYALTVGLKKACKGTPYQNILSGISDWVYSQLSDYAKDIISDSLKVQNGARVDTIRFENYYPSYRQESTMFERSMGNRYVYHEKRQGRYESGIDITYDKDGEVQVKKGVYIRDAHSGGIMIIDKNGRQKDCIEYDQIISITSSESEHGENTNYHRD